MWDTLPLLAALDALFVDNRERNQRVFYDCLSTKRKLFPYTTSLRALANCRHLRRRPYSHFTAVSGLSFTFPVISLLRSTPLSFRFSSGAPMKIRLTTFFWLIHLVPKYQASFFPTQLFRNSSVVFFNLNPQCHCYVWSFLEFSRECYAMYCNIEVCIASTSSPFTSCWFW